MRAAWSMNGTFQYQPELGERVRVYLQDYAAVDVAVHVNGAVAGHIPWTSEPMGSTSPAAWGRASTTSTFEVVSSPRNMLGPLHLATGRENWTDWRSFRRTDETYTPDYVLKDWGLYGQVPSARIEACQDRSESWLWTQSRSASSAVVTSAQQLSAHGPGVSA